MRLKAVEEYLHPLRDVPDHLKTQEICKRVVEYDPGTLQYVTDCLKTDEMCEKAAEEDPHLLRHVPDRFKTQNICRRLLKMNQKRYNM